MSSLLSPLKMGSLTLKNRIIMAPLTRCRCDDDRRIPNSLMAQYYAQRADSGLILTEATSISMQGVGYARTPGIWSAEQVAGWTKVVDAVHEQGGLIFLQLWHVGRISDPAFLGGELPVAPSAIAPSGKIGRLDPNRSYVTPRALEIEDIRQICRDYKRAAYHAKLAGFDGVELHGANGYLIEQFLREGSNLRQDEYGGTAMNRARFLREVLESVLEIWPSDRVGVHLSPQVQSKDLADSDPQGLYELVAKTLNEYQLGFVFTREHEDQDQNTPLIRKFFKGVLIGNERYTPESANRALEEGRLDAVSFGIPFISNPDLVDRIRLGKELAHADPASFYTPGPEGYIDYPRA